MYKIGEFSNLAKVTIKTLRYYEKEKLLIPKFIDNNGYRYYETIQLIKLSKIISLKQIGLTISEIKKIFSGEELAPFLKERKQAVLTEINEHKYQLSKINYLLEEEKMNYEIILKKLPECTIYYKEGTIKNFGHLSEFILSSGEECIKLNPNIECTKPDYCYVNYLDKAYKKENIKIRYAQAVKEKGLENQNIKFETLKPVEAICIYHKGPYDGLRNAYAFIMKYIEENNYEIIDYSRECYIDGIWNKDNEEDYLTEIEVPIKKRF